MREPRADEVEDVYSLRAELEVWAARRFVDRASAQDRADLEARLAKLKVAADTEDYPAFVDADMALHEVICQGSGSPLLVEIWTAMDNRVQGLRTSSRLATTRRYADSDRCRTPPSRQVGTSKRLSDQFRLLKRNGAGSVRPRSVVAFDRV